MGTTLMSIRESGKSSRPIWPTHLMRSWPPLFVENNLLNIFSFQAVSFRTHSHQLQRSMCLKNAKLTIILVALAGLVLFIIVTASCGGFTYYKCKWCIGVRDSTIIIYCIDWAATKFSISSGLYILLLIMCLTSCLIFTCDWDLIKILGISIYDR